MSKIEDVTVAEETSTILPPLYSAWVVQALGGPLPTETRATCADCVMCHPANRTDKPAGVYFNPEVKCCTWLPVLPNFLIGRILADDSPDAREGRVSVEERLQKRVAVTPFGFGQDAAFREVYYKRGERSKSFGHNRSLRCPHYIEEGGRCGIWKHRQAVCATWFCKYEHGALSKRFWNLANELLITVEEALAAWCAYRLDVGTKALALFLVQTGSDEGRHSINDRTTDPKIYKAIWGKWTGREKDFFRECASLVNPLTWDDVCTIGGSRLQLYVRVVQEVYKALQSPTIPPLLQVRPFRISDTGSDDNLAIGYSKYDPVRLSKPLRDVLPYFDGSPLHVIQQKILEEKKVRLSENLIRKLVDFDILGPVTE